MIIKAEGKFVGVPVVHQLEQVLNQLFALLPHLEFQAVAAKQFRADSRDEDTQNMICDVEVFSGEQKLGNLGYVSHYTKQGYEHVYRIYSRRIHKSRGDRNAKKTKSPKSAIAIAKQAFVKDSPDERLTKVYDIFKKELSSLSWEVKSKYDKAKTPLLDKAFQYVLSIADGETKPISAEILQALESDKFKQARDDYRITKAVCDLFESRSGVLVYVDRKNKITMADLDSNTFIKIESTYDLPTNYQEKYTMLKIMEFNQPIDHVGIKIKIDVDELAIECYYLAPGNTLVTH
jgi:hypothetical protein